MRGFLYRAGRSRWLRTFLGVLLLALIVWFFGPLLGVGETHPLVTEIARIIVIAALLVLWLVMNLVRELRASRRDKDLVDGVAKSAAPDADATASAEEVALLGERLRDALHALRRAKLGGRSRRHL